jgi:hypothetical protein
MFIKVIISVELVLEGVQCLSDIHIISAMGFVLRITSCIKKPEGRDIPDISALGILFPGFRLAGDQGQEEELHQADLWIQEKSHRGRQAGRRRELRL